VDEVDEAALERWFRALETVPDGGRAITAALYALSDNAVLDLVREAAEFANISGGWCWTSG
jgi:hypothetical protein